MSQPAVKKRTPLRLILMATAFVGLVCTGVSIALHRPTEKEIVQDRVTTLIDHVEKKQVSKFLAGTAENIHLVTNDRDEMVNKAAQEFQLGRLYRWSDTVSVKPQEMRISIDDNHAEVGFKFKFSASGTVPFRASSEPLPSAILFLEKTNNNWVVTGVEIKIPT